MYITSNVYHLSRDSVIQPESDKYSSHYLQIVICYSNNPVSTWYQVFFRTSYLIKELGASCASLAASVCNNCYHCLIMSVLSAALEFEPVLFMSCMHYCCINLQGWAAAGLDGVN